MPKFIVTIFEIHKQRVLVEAEDGRGAIERAYDGDCIYEHKEDGEHVTEFDCSADLEPEVEEADEAEAQSPQFADLDPQENEKGEDS